jgi:hypothetical protein
VPQAGHGLVLDREAALVIQPVMDQHAGPVAARSQRQRDDAVGLAPLPAGEAAAGRHAVAAVLHHVGQAAVAVRRVPGAQLRTPFADRHGHAGRVLERERALAGPRGRRARNEVDRHCSLASRFPI